MRTMRTLSTLLPQCATPFIVLLLLLLSLPRVHGNFYWGMIQNVPAYNATFGLLGLLALLAILEFAFPFVDYLLKETAIRKAFLQRITRELAAFGLLSIGTIGYVANSSLSSAWVLSLDSGYYLLLFIYVAYVLYCVFLFYGGYSSVRDYTTMHKNDPRTLLDAFDKLNALQKKLFTIAYLPLSNLRDACEFKVLEILFRDTYCLPDGFNFGQYLCLSQERHAAQLLDIGVFQWAIISAVALFNFMRIERELGFTCDAGNPAYSNNFVNAFSSPTSSHLQQSVTTSASGTVEIFDQLCSQNSLHLMFLAAMVMIFYSLIIVGVARIFELKLLRRAYCLVPRDYTRLLELESSTKKSKDSKVNYYPVDLMLAAKEEQMASASANGTNPPSKAVILEAAMRMHRELAKAKDETLQLQLRKISVLRSLVVDIRNADTDAYGGVASQQQQDEDVYHKCLVLGVVLYRAIADFFWYAKMNVLLTMGWIDEIPFLAAPPEEMAESRPQPPDQKHAWHSWFSSSHSPKVAPVEENIPDSDVPEVESRSRDPLNPDPSSERQKQKVTFVDRLLTGPRMRKMFNTKQKNRRLAKASTEGSASAVADPISAAEEASSRYDDADPLDGVPEWALPPPAQVFPSIASLVSDIVLPSFIGIVSQETIARRRRLVLAYTAANVAVYLEDLADSTADMASRRSSEAVAVTAESLLILSVSAQIRATIKKSLLVGPFFSLPSLYRAMDLNGDGVLQSNELFEYMRKFRELSHVTLEHAKAFITHMHRYGRAEADDELTIEEFRAFIEFNDRAPALNPFEFHSPDHLKYNPTTSAFRLQQVLRWHQEEKDMAAEDAERAARNKRRAEEFAVLMKNAGETLAAASDALATSVGKKPPTKEGDELAKTVPSEGETDEKMPQAVPEKTADEAGLEDIRSPQPVSKTSAGGGAVTDELTAEESAVPTAQDGAAKHDPEADQELTAPPSVPPLTEDPESLFPLNRSQLFYNCVKANSILLCLYVGFWATNMIAIAAHYPIRPDLWQILLFFPIVVVLQLLSASVKVSCRLQAVLNFDASLVVQIADEAIEAQRLKAEFKNFLHARIKEFLGEHMREREDKLELVDILFEIVDPAKATVKMQFPSFCRLVSHLGLAHAYVPKTLKLLYSAICGAGHDFIAKEDLFALLYPKMLYTDTRKWHGMLDSRLTEDEHVALLVGEEDDDERRDREQEEREDREEKESLEIDDFDGSGSKKVPSPTFKLAKPATTAQLAGGAAAPAALATGAAAAAPAAAAAVSTAASAFPVPAPPSAPPPSQPAPRKKSIKSAASSNGEGTSDGEQESDDEEEEDDDDEEDDEEEEDESDAATSAKTGASGKSRRSVNKSRRSSRKSSVNGDDEKEGDDDDDDDDNDDDDEEEDDEEEEEDEDD